MIKKLIYHPALPALGHALHKSFWPIWKISQIKAKRRLQFSTSLKGERASLKKKMKMT